MKNLNFNSMRKLGARATELGNWPFVIECAATAIFPGEMRYGGKANVALKLLTGLDSAVYGLEPNGRYPFIASNDLSESIVTALETNQPIMLASKKNGPIPVNHAFSVIDAVPASEEHGAMITIRNPWGRLGFNPQRAGLTEIAGSADGTFQIPIAALSKYFDDVVIPNNALRHSNEVCSRGFQQTQQSSNYVQNLPSVPRSYLSAGTSNSPSKGSFSSYINNRK